MLVWDEVVWVPHDGLELCVGCAFMSPCYRIKWKSILPMCCFGYMRSSCCDDIFVMLMMFLVSVLNTKVVDNSITLLVLKFHDFRPDGLGAIDFSISLSGFACSLYRSEWLSWRSYKKCSAFHELSKLLKITHFGGLNLQL